MVLRNIVKIDQDKCNGCGDCVMACAEGAIEIVDGKAKLISEIYCDGLGACLGHCPQDAITIEKKDSEEFDEQATEQHLAQMQHKEKSEFVCPGLMSQELTQKPSANESEGMQTQSQLSHWPVQLKLLSPSAPYLENADLLLVADCVPFAMGDFHSRFLKDSAIAVGCPKLDDTAFYIEKFAAILKTNKLNTLTVIHMEVPCCSGLVEIAKKAIKLAEIDLDFKDITITLDGSIKQTGEISVS